MRSSILLSLLMFALLTTACNKKKNLSVTSSGSTSITKSNGVNKVAEIITMVQKQEVFAACEVIVGEEGMTDTAFSFIREVDGSVKIMSKDSGEVVAIDGVEKFKFISQTKESITLQGINKSIEKNEDVLRAKEVTIVIDKRDNQTTNVFERIETKVNTFDIDVDVVSGKEIFIYNEAESSADTEKEIKIELMCRPLMGLDGFIKVVKNKFTTSIIFVEVKGKELLGAMKKKGGEIWNAKRELDRQTWNAVKAFVAPAVNKVKETVIPVIKKAKEAVVPAIKKAKEAVVPAIKKAKEAVVPAIKKAKDYKAELAVEFARNGAHAKQKTDEIIGGFNNTINTAKNNYDEFIDGHQYEIRSAKKIIGGALDKTKAVIKNAKKQSVYQEADVQDEDAVIAP